MVGFSPSSGQRDAYIDPQPVNTSMCLSAVEGLPLRVFGFKYDSKQGRRQVGVVGPELKQVMPDSVKIVPNLTTEKSAPIGKSR